MFPEILYPAVRHDNNALSYPQSMPRIPWPSWAEVKRFMTATGPVSDSPNYGLDMDTVGSGWHEV